MASDTAGVVGAASGLLSAVAVHQPRSPASSLYLIRAFPAMGWSMSHRNGPVGLSLVAGAAGIYFYTLRQMKTMAPGSLDDMAPLPPSDAAPPLDAATPSDMKPERVSGEEKPNK